MPKDAFGGKLVYSDRRYRASCHIIDAGCRLAAIRRADEHRDTRSAPARTRSTFSAKGFVKIYADRREKFRKVAKPRSWTTTS